MKFFYIDESEGSGSDPFNDIYLLGTVIVDESRLQSTEADIRQLSATIFGASHATFEFHGYDIYHGKGQFSGMNVPQRIAIVTSLMDIIEKNEIEIGYACIDKQKCYAKLHPHQLAFLFLVERIEDKLRQDGSLGLIVADENETMEHKLLSDLELFKIASTNFGWRPTQIAHVADTIHFVRSRGNRFVQLADIACGIMMRGIADSRRLFHRFLSNPGSSFPPMPWAEYPPRFGSKQEVTNIELWNRLHTRCRISKIFPC